MSKPVVLIFPFSKQLRNGKNNAKNYPFWKQVIAGLTEQGYEVVQVGIRGEPELASIIRNNCSLDELKELIQQCYFWISVDSFAQHLANLVGKRGVVLWSMSDPKIFGYSTNINILKDKNYLRERQFDIWEAVEFNADAFAPPERVLSIIKMAFSPSEKE